MMSVSSLMVTSAAIIGSHLADNPAWASLPLALTIYRGYRHNHPGLAVNAQAIGRRAGFLVASMIGIIGASMRRASAYISILLCCFCMRYAWAPVSTPAFGHLLSFCGD